MVKKLKNTIRYTIDMKADCEIPIEIYDSIVNNLENAIKDLFVNSINTTKYKGYWMNSKKSDKPQFEDIMAKYLPKVD